MKPEMEPNKIKRKVNMTYFQDGLWDIVLGIFLLGWGFTVWFDLPWLPGAIFVSFFWLALGLKQKITYPRIGYARPAGYRNSTLKMVIAGIAILVVVILLLPVVNRGGLQILQNYFELLFNSIMAIAFGLIGYWWGVTRWYAYAALVFVMAVFNQWLGLSFTMSFLIPGGLITICGIIIFSRFIRKYPVTSVEVFDANR